MTGRVSAIQRFSTEDGPGIRTTVFLQGCNLHCPWCHNPETIGHGPVLMYFASKCIGCGMCAQACPSHCHVFSDDGHAIDRRSCHVCGSCAGSCLTGALELRGCGMAAENVFARMIRDVDFYRKSGGGITLSGGEPMLQPEFCAELGRMCRDAGIHVLVDTAACVPYAAFEAVLDVADAFYVDFKLPDAEKYRNICGGALELVKENASRLVRAGKQVTARVPVIPGVNNDSASLAAIAGHIRDCGIAHTDWLPFHRLGMSKYEAMNMRYAFEGYESMSMEDIRKNLP